jgi:hypothetical protein
MKFCIADFNKYPVDFIAEVFSLAKGEFHKEFTNDDNDTNPFEILIFNIVDITVHYLPVIFNVSKTKKEYLNNATMIILILYSSSLYKLPIDCKNEMGKKYYDGLLWLVVFYYSSIVNIFSKIDDSLLENDEDAISLVLLTFGTDDLTGFKKSSGTPKDELIFDTLTRVISLPVHIALEIIEKRNFLYREFEQHIDALPDD